VLVGLRRQSRVGFKDCDAELDVVVNDNVNRVARFVVGGVDPRDVQP
jgi:hypothetical protein